MFLTLFPDQNPESKQYSVHRYSELKEVLANVTRWGNELAKQLVRDWLALVEPFYESENVTPSDVFYSILKFLNVLKKNAMPHFYISKMASALIVPMSCPTCVLTKA